MTISLFFGSSLFAAMIAGMIALFAPCCISFMLPAYFASAVKSKRGLIAMTFIFAAGVATIVLPLTLGASFLWGLFLSQHKTIYLVGGLFLIAMAAYTFLGGKIHLPIPALTPDNGTPGIRTSYILGVFSGITSSCCAPVLAGVIALSSVASSFGTALIFGGSYVFGMVAPLFIISLLWESRDWTSFALFRPRRVTWHIGSFTRKISSTDLASSILLTILGVIMIWVGFTFTGMQRYSTWQINMLLTIQRIGHSLTSIFGWMPNWLMGLILIIIIALLARRGISEAKRHDETISQIHDERV